MNKEVERKWLLSEVPEITWEHQVLTIEQIYNPYNVDRAERVRRITDQEGNNTFFHCVKTPAGYAASMEDEKEISEDEYNGKADQYHRAGANKVVKKRIVFEYGNHLLDWVYEVDVFQRPKAVKGLVVLEVELSDVTIEPPIPDELSVVSEVTGNTKFANKQISLEPWKATREAMRVALKGYSGNKK